VGSVERTTGAGVGESTAERRRSEQLLVLGASGRTGRQVVVQALATGRRVTAFVHEPRKVWAEPNLSVVAGDALVPADLRSALAGCDAVVDTIGVRRAGDQALAAVSGALVQAMSECGVTRVVLMSHFVADPAHRRSPWAHLRHPMERALAADAASAEEVLRTSDLAWTIVRCAPLVNRAATGRVRIAPDANGLRRASRVARADVAAFLLDVLDDPASLYRTVLVEGA